MLAATLLAVFIVPVLYVVVNNFAHKPVKDEASAKPEPALAGGSR